MRHAPSGYECPFCRLARAVDQEPDAAVVFADAQVFAVVPLHQYAGIKGNCLVIPRLHYENVLDIPDSLGAAFFNATRRVARAMLGALLCEGISTRQHNGPAGDQDVWHFHLHVFPRNTNDGLYGGEKALYSAEERIELAARLRAALP